ncbi:MAG: heme lyase CcmF/NrfE family subunit, partial [Chloroflexi bacterium]|nr:heme lyase CcmF/NrfE family subunit [Chloroflexota bacterium]
LQPGFGESVRLRTGNREVAFLVNNFLLLGITFVTLWGVVFPLITEFSSDSAVTVAAPYFNRVNGPLFLILLALMGIGPVMAWRKASPSSLRRWLAWPVPLAILVAIGLLISGIREPVAVVAFAVLAFVAMVILEEWFRGTRARRSAGDTWVRGFVRMIAANRPRHGGYIVHLAVLSLAFGVIGTQFFDQRTDFVLREGESGTIGGYRVEYAGREIERRSDRIAQWANVNVYRGERLAGRLEPWHAVYPDFSQVSVRAGIRSNPVEDLYLVPSDFLDDGRLVLRASVNPLAWWLWLAGPVFLLGTVIALWPQAVPEVRTAAATRPASPRSITPGAVHLR